MWTTFLICILVCVFVLYLPGFLLFRALGFDCAMSLALAPLGALAFYALLAIAYGFLGVYCSWITLFLPTTIITAIAYVGRRILKPSLPPLPHNHSPLWVLCIYGVFGCLLCLYMFVIPLDGPDSFYCRADNITHLNQVRYFLESGTWSSLLATTGATSFVNTVGSFYPSLWHDLVALVASFTNADPIIAVNAVNAVICGVVYPVSAYALMRALFPKSKHVLIVGAIAAMAFAAWPWTFLIKGPLVSNLLSFALLPGMLGAFVVYVTAGLKRHWLGATLSALLSLISIVFAQPNGVFSALVFVIPFVLSRVASRFSVHRGLVWAGGILGWGLLWFALQQLSFLQNIINFPNAGGLNLTLGQSLSGTLEFVFYVNQPAQVLLVFLAVVGAYSLIHNRRGWMLIPGLYMLTAYTISRCTDGPIRTFFCGFWYNDPWRLSDNAAIFLVPILAVGLVRCITLFCDLVTKRRGVHEPYGAVSESATPLFRQVIAIAILVVFCIVNFFPSYRMPDSEVRDKTAFGFARDRLAKEYEVNKSQIYSSDERAFVEKVLEIIPEGSVVINSPEDGSVFAYGVNGLNTYYRSTHSGGFTDDANLIRGNLNLLTTIPDVESAVERIPANYVLLLDQGVSFDEGEWLLQTTENSLSEWDGINRITDETPGFEVVLSEGNMRLYKIVGAEQSCEAN